MASPACGDFLSDAGRRPGQAEFTGCEPGRSAQLRTLVATYRVPGRDAAAVEHFLRRHTGMPRLRFVCCGWEPDLRHGRRAGAVRLHGETLEVSMGSGESTVRERARWDRIPSFQVTVTRYVDLP